MTETTTSPTTSGPAPDDIAWRGKGRPVRWVAAAVVGATALSLAAVWSGAFAPMVSQTSSGQGPMWSGEMLVVSVHLENEAVVGTRIVAAGRSTPGAELVGVAVTPGDRDVVPEAGSTLPDGGVVLPGGRGADVVLRYEVDCARLAAAAMTVPVRFRTPAGLTRTIDATEAATFDGNLAGTVAGLCGPPAGGDG